MEKKRSSFSGGIGFVLAAAGSAVGLGNLWRFPYLAAQYGGGIFILVYIVLALTFGFTLLMTEIAIGRKTKKSASVAFKDLHGKFRFLGFLECLVPVIILPYYSVIGGWVVKYMAAFIGGEGTAAAGDDYFNVFIGGTASPLLYFAIFFGVTALIILLGVEKGIEKISKFLMPVLLVITIFISIYVATLPGAWEGIKYYILPDFDKFSFKTVCAAMGQMFFSLSIAMGILITYGSYTKDETNMAKSVNQIEIFDTVVALLAGFMVVPAVYIFSGEAGTAAKGPGLMFVTLPKVFEQMNGGAFIGALFFVLVLLAALTSSISIMEAVVSSIMDRFKLSRAKSCIVCIVISVILGVPSALGFGPWAGITVLGMDFLTFFDYLSNSVLMPIVGLAVCILIGWILGPDVILKEVTKNGERLGRAKLYRVMIKYIAPILLVTILVVYSLDAFGVIKI